MGIEIQVDTLEDMCELMCDNKIPRREKRKETPQERARRQVYATGNKWAIENFEATHS